MEKKKRKKERFGKAPPLAPGFHRLATTFDVVVLEKNQLPEGFEKQLRLPRFSHKPDEEEAKRMAKVPPVNNYWFVLNSVEAFRKAVRRVVTLVMTTKILGIEADLVYDHKDGSEKKAKPGEEVLDVSLDTGEGAESDDWVGEDEDGYLVDGSAEDRKKDEKGKKKPVKQRLQFRCSKERSEDLRKLIGTVATEVNPENPAKYKSTFQETRGLIMKEFFDPRFFCPRSHLGDHVRIKAIDVLTANDPKLKVPRVALIEDGQREINDCNYLGMPVLNSPKARGNVRFNFVPKVGRVISACWDNWRGWVHFKIIRRKRKGRRAEKEMMQAAMSGKPNRKATLDPLRQMIWEKICGNENRPAQWATGTIVIREENRRLRIDVPYVRAFVTDPKQIKTREMHFEPFADTPEAYLQMYVWDPVTGKYPVEGWSVTDELRGRSISVLDRVDLMHQWRAQSDKLKGLRAACGSRRARNLGYGNRRGFDAIAERGRRLSLRREQIAVTANHQWTKDIVHRARQWHCTKIVFHNCPSELDKRDREEAGETDIHNRVRGLCGYEWSWSNFKLQLKSKAEREGIEVEYVTSDAGEVISHAAAGN